MCAPCSSMSHTSRGQQAFVDNALATSNADYNLVIVSARASTSAMHASISGVC